MAGVDLTNYEKGLDDVRRRGGPPPVEPSVPPEPTPPDLRPKSRVVGKQGEAFVVQHPGGDQTVVGEKGLKDLGIKP